jgi:hypothetical protein
MRSLVVFFLLATAALPAFGQAEAAPERGNPLAGAALSGRDFQAYFSGMAFPPMLTLKELSSEWWRITVGSPGELALLLQVLASRLGSGGQSYYTKGQTVTVGSETYLVAYRPPAGPVDPGALMPVGPDTGPPKLEKLTPETPLSLSLLNLRTTGSFNDIRPFDLERQLRVTDAVNAL